MQKIINVVTALELIIYAHEEEIRELRQRVEFLERNAIRAVVPPIAVDKIRDREKMKKRSSE